MTNFGLRLDSAKARKRSLIGERHGVILGVITLVGTATQFRSAGSAGIGELLLVLFVLLTFRIPNFRSFRPTSSPINTFVLAWLFLSVVGILFNWLSSASLDLSNIGGIGPPALLLVVTTYVSTRPSPDRLLRPWAKTFGWGFLGSQTLLLLCGHVMRKVGPINPYFEDVRFQGWTTNPNQLAFLTLIAGFAVLHSLKGHRLLALGATLLTVLIGLSTDSDAFKVAVLVGLLALNLFYIFAHQAQGSKKKAAGVAFFALVYFGAAWNWGRVIDWVRNAYGFGEQGSFRVSLWRSCVDRILSSPLTGYGPGGHAVVPETSLQMECHNTILDLSTIGGVFLGGFALILFSKIALDARNRGHLSTVIAIAALMTMSMFGFVFRYPTFWLFVCLIRTSSLGPQFKHPTPSRRLVTLPQVEAPRES